MKAVEFCYWLQGYFEINEKKAGRDATLTEFQVETIKKHLAMVFKHEIDPSYPVEQQKTLNNLHGKRPDMGDGLIRC